MERSSKSSAERLRQAVENPSPDRWVWRRRDNKQYFHMFKEGAHTVDRSRCGMISYPQLGETKVGLAEYEKCSACLKISKGLPANSKRDYNKIR